MSNPSTEPTSEKPAAPEASPNNHLDPSDLKKDNGAASGASSISDNILHKEKTHEDVGPESNVDAAKTKTNATVLSRIASRVATGPELPQSLRLVVIMVALALAMFLAALDMTIIGTAIPAITDEFHSLGDVGWYGSAFFLTIAAFQAFWGKLYKYFPCMFPLPQSRDITTDWTS